MFDTVLVATDGSGSGARAVETALDLAADIDADIHAVSVVEPGDPDGTTQAEAAVDAVQAAVDGTVETAILEGEPAREICDYATAVDADLITMGTRGRGSDSFHLGSVAERVVEQAPVPVLTVRQYSGLDSRE